MNEETDHSNHEYECPICRFPVPPDVPNCPNCKTSFSIEGLGATIIQIPVAELITTTILAALIAWIWR